MNFDREASSFYSLLQEIVSKLKETNQWTQQEQESAAEVDNTPHSDVETKIVDLEEKIAKLLGKNVEITAIAANAELMRLLVTHQLLVAKKTKFKSQIRDY